LRLDEDWQVSDEAGRSIVNYRNCKIITTGELEEKALPLLQNAYENDKIQQVEALFFLCKGKLSMPILEKIYLREKEGGTNFEFKGHDGAIEAIKYIDLKSSILEILKQNPSDISEGIRSDISKNIKLYGKDVNHKYIIAAGDFRINEAFDPLIGIINLSSNKEGILENRNWIIRSLIQIDSKKAATWAIDTLKLNPLVDLSFICFEILHQLGEKQSELIEKQILRLMGDPDVSSDKRIYNYIRNFKVIEVIPTILRDIVDKRHDNIVKYELLNTLAYFKTMECRNALINELRNEEDETMILYLIRWLCTIGDPESLAVIREYSNYPDPEIEREVKKYCETV